MRHDFPDLSPSMLGLAGTLPAVLVAVLLAGCDSGNPVIESPTAPPSTSTIYTITLSVSPSQLEAGSASPATVSVDVIQDDTGLAPTDGTLVTLDTDFGNFGTSSDGEVTTLSLALGGGKASANLFAPAEVGTATLAASVGISVSRASVAIVEATEPGVSAFFITSITPQSGPDEGGQTVTLGGGGFSSPAQVLIGGATAPITSIEASSIVATTPASAAPVAAGETLVVDVDVTIDLDTEAPRTVTLTGSYTYVAEGGTTVFITSIDPTSGGATGGEQATISGGGFMAPARVTFGGIPTDTEPEVADDGSQITVVVPAPSPELASGERRIVDLEVTSGLDQASPQVVTLPSAYTYVAEDAPVEVITLQSIDPSRGNSTGGTAVTITGSGFISPVAVDLAGVRQSAETVVSDTEVTFSTVGITLDTCPASGEVAQQGLTVTNLTSGVDASANFLFTYTVLEPRISSVEPPSGSQVGNVLITLFGTDFDPPVDVTFIAGERRFSAEVRPGTLSSNVTVVLPRVDATIFPEVDCTVNDDAGKQYLPVNVDVELVNLDSQCLALFAGGFTYEPSNSDCRPITAGE